MPARPFSHPIDQCRPARQDRLIVQITLQVRGKFLSRPVSFHRILAHGFEDDRFHLDGNVLIDQAGRERFVMDDVVQQLLAVSAGEDRLQCHEFVQGGA